MAKKNQSVIACIFSENKKKVLLTKRKDVPVWVLPGGGIEDNETIENAIIREVKEETGFDVGSIAALIAAMSPQQRWDGNLVGAQYTARAISEDHEVQVDLLLNTTRSIRGEDEPITLFEEMLAEMQGIKRDDQVRFIPPIESLRGKKLSEIEDPYVVASIIKAHGKAGYRVEGIGGNDPDGNSLNIDGQPLGSWNDEDGGRQGLQWSSGMTMVGRGIRVLRGETPDDMLNGLKVRSFFNNILGSSSAGGPGNVTVDTHALSAALNRRVVSGKGIGRAFGGSPSSKSLGVTGFYPVFADAYRVIAEKYDLEPRQLQAIVWTWWRKKIKAQGTAVGEVPQPGVIQ
jgi:8-oxo-dGTP pyrophosphatase MutT (NUDIX family)